MSTGAFYFRAESRDWDLASRVGDRPPFDAAIICDRYLAEYPLGHELYGQPADRLARAFESAAIPWIHDPETSRLAHPDSEELQSSRDALRPQANVLPLPITPELLSDDDGLAALIEAAELNQLGSYALAVPYFEATSLEDPYLQLNLELIARARQIAGDRELVAYLQVLRSRVANGLAAEMLRRFVDAGAETVVIRVRGVRPEIATAAEALHYMRLVAAGARAGARVVADCASRLGPALVAAGADAFSAGSYRFRSVPKDLHPRGGGRGSEPLAWELPGGGAVTLGKRASKSCTVVGCKVPNSSDATSTRQNKNVRIHNCHTFQADARAAAGLGLGYAAILSQSADPTVRSWALALQELARRAA